MAERINRTVQNMLKALKDREKSCWKDHLPKLAFAYNSTVNKTTGYSPFFLLFGRQSKLPVDSMFGLDRGEAVGVARKSHAQFVEDWKRSMTQAYDLANQNIEKSANYNKQHYDKKVKGEQLKVGDRVLVRNVRERGGTGKLRNHWESTLFEVTAKKENLPVYTITNVDNNKDCRTVHRNLLMECNDLPRDVFVKEKAKDVKKAKNTTMGKKKHESAVEQKTQEEDDEDIGNIVVLVHEDVADFSLGGGGDVVEIGDSVDGIGDIVDGLADTGEESSVDGDDHGEPESADPETDENAESESDTDDPDDPAPKPSRKSVRVSRAPKIFSYDEVGGPPVLIEINK
jgi:hypothetical protein